MARQLREARIELVREVDQAAIDLAPLRGLWTVEQYLAITDATSRLVEFVDNTIEMLPLPTDRHQTLLEYLFLALREYIVPRGGKVLFAALRLEVSAGRFREPDLLLLRDANDPRRQERYWRGADLVAEIVSPDDPERDTVDKVADYAAAGIG